VGVEWCEEGCCSHAKKSCARRLGAPEACPAEGNAYQQLICVRWRSRASRGPPWGDIEPQKCRKRQKTARIGSPALRPTRAAPKK
jgi:hypothetical protein